LLGQVASYGAAHFNIADLLTTTQQSTPASRIKPSAAEKGGSGVSPDYDNPTRTKAEEGKAERSGKGGGSDFDTTQRAVAPKKAKRSGEAERGRVEGFEGLS
jgi:hypothetical protein